MYIFLDMGQNGVLTSSRAERGWMPMVRKTKLMQQVEERYQRPLERLLPEMVNERGLSHTAVELGVSKATLGYWLLKLGINVRRVALAPGETLEVKRTS